MIDTLRPEGCNSFWPYFILFPFSLSHCYSCSNLSLSQHANFLLLSSSHLVLFCSACHYGDPTFSFSLFLKLSMIFFCPTSVGRPLPEIISVPIKVCVKLGAWRAQQEGWSCYDWGRIVTTVKALTLLSAHFEEILTRTSVIQMSPLAYPAPRWFIKYWKLFSSLTTDLLKALLL